MMELSEQEKREIVYELRGIAQDIDVEFEHMVINDTYTKNIDKVEGNLKNILRDRKSVV